jgi:hypothetical protein
MQLLGNTEFYVEERVEGITRCVHGKVETEHRPSSILNVRLHSLENSPVMPRRHRFVGDQDCFRIVGIEILKRSGHGLARCTWKISKLEIID